MDIVCIACHRVQNDLIAAPSKCIIHVGRNTLLLKAVRHMTQNSGRLPFEAQSLAEAI